MPTSTTRALDSSGIQNLNIISIRTELQAQSVRKSEKGTYLNISAFIVVKQVSKTEKLSLVIRHYV